MQSPATTKRFLTCAGLTLLLGAGACGDDAPAAAPGSPSDAGGSSSSSGVAASSGSSSSSSSSGSSSGSAPTDAGTDASTAALHACGDRKTTKNSWLQTAFANDPDLTGTFTSRQFVELPRLVHDATVTGPKYAFDFRETEAPVDPRVALVNVDVSDLHSEDGFGGSFVTDKAPGAHVFLSNVYFEPNWPDWVGYDSTNYDGMTLDGSEEVFGEDVTVKNWNADTAADIKSKRAQFVCLTTLGEGHRTLRLWHVGPHYLVKSTLHNDDGVIIWMQTCTGAKIYVYDSTFNGEPQLPANKLECNDGGQPEITYLGVDPRTTGEMHPMFSAP